jgi:hypothetical protein
MSFFSKLLTRMHPEGSEPGAGIGQDEQDAFALHIQSILRAAGVESTYDQEDFALRLDNGSVSWLGNRFDEFLHTPPDEREALLLQVVEGIAEAGRPAPVSEDPEVARPRLRPRIRQRAHLGILRMQMEAQGMTPEGPLHTFVPITDDLVAEVVYDTPTNIVNVPGERLDAWSMTAEEALQVAVDNLRQATPQPFDEIGDGVWMPRVGDCYDSARLLLPEAIDALPVEGEPVALPANRDTLAITGADNLGGLYRLLQLAMAAMDQPRMDTLQPVVWRDGRWQDWLPPADHPMREPWYELAIRTRGSSYAELRDLLRERDRAAGIDRFVASYGALRPTEGAPPRSHAVWAPVHGWLPEADLISVIAPDESRYVLVTREVLLEHAGHLLTPVPDVHPPYRSFDGPPDPSLWNRLREHALHEGEMGEP